MMETSLNTQIYLRNFITKINLSHNLDIDDYCDLDDNLDEAVNMSEILSITDKVIFLIKLYLTNSKISKLL